MKYVRSTTVVLVLLLSIAFSVFAEEPKSETKAATATPAEQQASGKEKRFVAVADASGLQRVEITGGEFFFDPNYIVVKVNTQVELTAKKAKGLAPHDLIVKAPEAGINIKLDLDSEQPAIVRFTPTRVGKYPMYCSQKFLFFKSHRDRGMEGVIEVVE